MSFCLLACLLACLFRHPLVPCSCFEVVLLRVVCTLYVILTCLFVTFTYRLALFVFFSMCSLVFLFTCALRTHSRRRTDGQLAGV